MTVGLWHLSKKILLLNFYRLNLSQLNVCIQSYIFTRKKKLLSCSNNPKKIHILNHLGALRRNLDLYNAQYAYLILLGDCNVKFKEPCMELSSNIDLIKTSSSSSFQCSCVIETSMFDFHKMSAPL